MAVAVTNMVLSHKPGNDEAANFLRANWSSVLEKAMSLSSDRGLCKLLSGAAYNFSYAHYLSTGGKRSFLSNPFLGFVRALSRSYADASDAMDAYALWRSCQDTLKQQRGSVEPLIHLHELGLFVPLEYNPNEKAYYDAVVQRAKQLGL